MNSVHLVIPDLFLPKDICAEAVAGLYLPALQMMLGRGQSMVIDPVPLENVLCEIFGMPDLPDAPIAPVAAAFDGLAAGCWLRADPVNLDLQRDRLLLNTVPVRNEESAAMCASLNDHFAGQGMEFFAPHPQRWYVRLNVLPRMRTVPLSQVVGSDVRMHLPSGEDAVRWHQVLNEMQMLLSAHPINETRQARGEPTINSVWFWGAGCDSAIGSLRSSGQPIGLPLAGALLEKPAVCGSTQQAAATSTEEAAASSFGGGYGMRVSPQNKYDMVISDDALTEMLAWFADCPFSAWTGEWRDEPANGRQLLVWTGLRAALLRGDLVAWRTALQDFETGYAQPIWQALKSGQICGVQVDILGSEKMQSARLSRGNTWAFWRHSKRLADYSLV